MKKTKHMTLDKMFKRMSETGTATSCPETTGAAPSEHANSMDIDLSGKESDNIKPVQAQSVKSTISGPSYPDIATVARGELEAEWKLSILKDAWTDCHLFNFPSRSIHGKMRKLSSSWLIDHPWLRYSISTDALFCAPCFVFGRKDAKEKTFISTPVKDWSNLASYVKRHEIAESNHHNVTAMAEHFLDIQSGIIRLNAAAGMQVSMSSVHAGMDATKAIDGQLVDDPETCGCCSETTNEYSSWWQVDLGRPFFLKKVILYGRLNENVFRQLVGFSILISLTNEFPDNPVQNQNGEIQDSKVAVLLSDVAARYVRIQRLGILTICEVELVQSDIICPTYTYGRDCTPCGPCRNGSCDRVTGDCPSGCYDGYEGNMCEKLTVHKSTYNDVIIGVIGAGVGVVTSLLVVALVVALFRYKKRRTRIYEEPSVKWAKEPAKESAYATLENQEIVIEKEETYDNPI